MCIPVRISSMMSLRSIVVFATIIVVSLAGALAPSYLSSHLPDPPAQNLDEYQLARRYAGQLLSGGDDGLVAIGHERAIKAAIALVSRDDCFLIGSSRIMTIEPSSLSKIATECSAAGYNLGVSGGGLEDAITFAGLIAGAKSVFFGIDHWTFRYGADDRFMELSPAYHAARCRFRISDCEGSKSLRRIWSSLQNAGGVGREKFRPASHRTEAQASTRKDGSHDYSQQYRHAMQKHWDAAHLTYKLAAPGISARAVEDFMRMVRALRQDGMNVYFLFVPYHPRAAACESIELCLALAEVEKTGKDIAAASGVAWCGSFRSTLNEDDFISDIFADPERLIFTKESCN